jgi:hypothetical protein
MLPSNPVNITRDVLNEPDEDRLILLLWAIDTTA